MADAREAAEDFGWSGQKRTLVALSRLEDELQERTRRAALPAALRKTRSGAAICQMGRRREAVIGTGLDVERIVAVDRWRLRSGAAVAGAAHRLRLAEKPRLRGGPMERESAAVLPPLAPSSKPLSSSQSNPSLSLLAPKCCRMGPH